MTTNILPHAEDDRNELEIAKAFAFQQPLDPTLEARVEASAVGMTASPPDHGLIRYWMDRAAYWRGRFQHAHQGNVEAKDILEQAIARAEKAEQRNVSLFHLIAAWERNGEELQHDLQAATEKNATLKSELVIIGAALDVAERQRKQAETEAAGFKRAITHWHLEGQRWEAEALKAQNEAIQLRVELTELRADHAMLSAALEEANDAEL